MSRMFKAFKPQYWIAMVLFLGLIGIMGWQYCSPGQQTDSEIPLVRTLIVDAANTPQLYKYSGEVHSCFESSLAFQTSGKIIKRNIEIGSRVRAGEVLMQLDPQDKQNALDSISAQMASAQSQYNLVKETLDRSTKLYEQGALSKANFDSAQNAVNVSEASLRQLNAQYTLSQNQLEYTSLRADRDGVVTGIFAEEGQVILATAQALTVVTIAENKNLEVEIAVPENRVETISKAKDIKATFWAYPEITLKGKVREVAPGADPVSKTYKARITLINPHPEIKLGMTATIFIEVPGREKNVVLLPLSAIYQTGKEPQVWIVQDHTVKLKEVTLKSFAGDQVQIADGLHGGEVVVTAGVNQLIEGQKVRTRNEININR